MESGDGEDFKYANDFVYPPIKGDRILRNGDTINMDDLLLTAYHTPGHARGATCRAQELDPGPRHAAC
jgi:metallo-beta-lactamase class B